MSRTGSGGRTMLELFSRIRRMKLRFLPMAFRGEHGLFVIQSSPSPRNPPGLLTASGHMKEVESWVGFSVSVDGAVAARRNTMRYSHTIVLVNLHLLPNPPCRRS